MSVLGGASVSAVKVEDVPPGQAHDVEATEINDDGADFGEDAPATVSAKPEPVRAMPDYGDLIDDEDDKGDLEGQRPGRSSKAELRPDALRFSGVQRLTRSHLQEIFQSKNLPQFQRLEWIADDEVLCIFATPEDTAAALAGTESGFSDVSVKSSEKPGPGLWRAQRGMLEIRQATLEDEPSAEFKRQHRGGRQVREFRFWEAIKDVDRNILDDSEFKAQKRELPSGEDAIAAANWDDGTEAPAKRRRRAAGNEEEAPISLLEQMSQLDKQILAKHEEEAKTDGEPKADDTSLVLIEWDQQAFWGEERYSWRGSSGGKGHQDAGESWGRHAEETSENAGKGQRRRPERKIWGGHDDRGQRDSASWENWRNKPGQDSAEWSKWDSWGSDAGWGKKRRSEGVNGVHGDRERAGDAPGAEPLPPGPVDRWLHTSEEEKAKRQKRADRFRSDREGNSTVKSEPL